MLAKDYIRSVNFRLNLPPWYRLRELNTLAAEIREYEQSSGICTDLENVLGSPDEQAERIQFRYPMYESSSLRIFPLFLGIACGIGFLVQLISKICYMRRNFVAEQVINALEVPDFLFSPEYVSYPEAITASPVHSPEEIMLFCGIGVLLGIILYFWLSYIPKK